MRGRGGFSLMELLVVLFILSLFAALAAPSFSRTLLSGRMRACAAEVRATLSKARSHAIAEGRTRFVVFNLEEGTFGLDSDAVLRGFPEPIQLGSLIVAGEEVRGTTARVRFFPDGTAEEAEISVASGDGGMLLLRMDPLTGIVEVAQ
ncbi:MAG: prepilin-type N-terminal cleavage/methylation domain-containing protein [Syntrophorhabdaceae bacterium]|nr:prepilin-type N-terminal cleavage/methylation domain-containing protein [Syntrophorhabdaceae bacterium]